jgi:hypothetical protein
VLDAGSLALLGAMAASGVQGVLVAPSGLFYQGKAKIAALAFARKLPTCWWAGELMVPGARLAYGPSLAAIVRRAPLPRSDLAEFDFGNAFPSQ